MAAFPSAPLLGDPVSLSTSPRASFEFLSYFTPLALKATLALFAPAPPSLPSLTQLDAFLVPLSELLAHCLRLRQRQSVGEMERSGALDAIRQLMRLDLVRRENLFLVLMYPVVLSSAPWCSILAYIVGLPRPPPPPTAPYEFSVAAISGSRALSQYPLSPGQEVCTQLVFAEIIRQVSQSHTPSVEVPVNMPPSLRLWQATERSKWNRWVQLGVRKQPDVLDEDSTLEDGGLSFENYAHLLHILDSRYLKAGNVSDYSSFLQVYPSSLKANSELFLMKKGHYPLWESTPHGATLEYTFSNRNLLDSIWKELVPYACDKLLFYEDHLPLEQRELGLLGFSVVKRTQNKYRLTLWLERYSFPLPSARPDSAPLPPLKRRRLHSPHHPEDSRGWWAHERAPPRPQPSSSLSKRRALLLKKLRRLLPPLFQTCKFFYSSNAVRIAKHGGELRQSLAPAPSLSGAPS